MSDRIAVFNEGRIEQVATPVELYEHPASAFVAAFVGTSNLLDGPVAERLLGTPGSFIVRPEKVRLVAAVDAPDGDAVTCVAEGRVRDVVYLGAATHTVVELDAGATLTVARQNSDRVDAAPDQRDERVALVWRRDHLVSLGGPPDPVAFVEEEAR